MTNKGQGTSSPWVDGNVLSADDLLDTIAFSKWNFLTTSTSLGDVLWGTIRHSASAYSSTAGGMHFTSDTGVTWAADAGTESIDTAPIVRVCEAALAEGFVAEASGNMETAYTSDSGANWTATTVLAMGNSLVYDLSFPVSALVVVAGDDGGGAKHIVYSTNQGTAWTDPVTSPNVACGTVSMFDDTTGYAVDTNSNIWKSNDPDSGVAKWADTTDNTIFPAGVNDTCLAVTADILLIGSAGGDINYYVNSTNTVTAVFQEKGYDISLGFVTTTNGNIYTGWVDTTGTVCAIAGSTDSGLTWTQMVVFNSSSIGSTRTLKSALVEWGTNGLAVATNSNSYLRVFRDSD
jgi:hypothetical protein|tara:strand:- start:7333 stop:8376 length:1044 start_codon:yes stop_codon:yes gene_type:complete